MSSKLAKISQIKSVSLYTRKFNSITYKLQNGEIKIAINMKGSFGADTSRSIFLNYSLKANEIQTCSRDQDDS